MVDTVEVLEVLTGDDEGDVAVFEGAVAHVRVVRRHDDGAGHMVRLHPFEVLPDRLRGVFEAAEDRHVAGLREHFVGALDDLGDGLGVDLRHEDADLPHPAGPKVVGDLVRDVTGLFDDFVNRLILRGAEGASVQVTADRRRGDAGQFRDLA